MLTADELATVQTYGHENGEAISYENPSGIFILYACGTRASCPFSYETKLSPGVGEKPDHVDFSGQ